MESDPIVIKVPERLRRKVKPSCESMIDGNAEKALFGLQ
jgi:hypothetical protein